MELKLSKIQKVRMVDFLTAMALARVGVRSKFLFYMVQSASMRACR